MRQLKFRAWNRRTNKMENYLEIRLDTLCDISDNENKYYMQYTGLEDKKGVNIYEGDIVKVKTEDKYKLMSNDSKSEFTGKVWYCKYMCRFLVVGLEDENDEIEFNNFNEKGYIEVIGNIYENKDLLK